MATDFKFQVNTKLPSGALINVRGDDEDEFRRNIEFVAEIAQDVVDLDTALVAASRVSLGGLTPASPGVQQSQQDPSQPTQSQGEAPVGGVLGTAQDRYNNLYESGIPGAPLTPRGPAVRKSATSQKGNAYKVWCDPCEHPNYQGDRNPADKFERQFTR